MFKTGGSLSPLLFNICMDPSISYLRKSSDLGYDADELCSSVIQVYGDDKILISNSEQYLQILIN
jgi:hypothetical protein